MMRLLCVLGVAGLLAAAPAAHAGGKPKAGKKKDVGVAALFKKLDANGDGKLSVAEFAKITELGKGGGAKVKVKKAEKVFAKLDANGDGVLSLEEFKKIGELKKKKKDK